MIFQELNLLPNLTVAENVLLLREPRRPGWRVDRKRMAEETRALLDRLGFRLRASDRVRDLGFAQRQLVEIVKAVSRGAEVLIMDEPTSSLTVRRRRRCSGSSPTSSGAATRSSTSATAWRRISGSPTGSASSRTAA